jgi:selenocysteine-specific elongation factor
VVIGTAGHIDHGKTSLVQALTGRNTDRLPEERRRGISIDLGYAQLSLAGERSASIVDVPGHERFVRHMVAGASGIDAYLLVVACDDGVMRQTREHLRILDLLGIDRGVCALTKRDAVDDETAEFARMEVEELLDGRVVEIVETSARTGLGLDQVRAALARLTVGSAAPSREDRARLWVDRTFSLPGAGTIATGTLWSGTIAARDRLAAMPGGHEARVRSVQVHDRDVEVAHAGSRVAVALTGVTPRQLPRGTLLCPPGAFPLSYRLDVALSGVERDQRAFPVTVHHGTAEHLARLVVAGPGYGQLRLSARVSAMRGDRIVLRHNDETLGGGVVVDPSPPHRVDLERIRRFAEGSPEEVLETMLDASLEPMAEEDLLRRGLLTWEELRESLASAVHLDGRYVTRRRFEDLSARVLERLATRAEEFPLDPGIAAEEVGPPGRWRDAFLASLPVERRGSRVYAAGVVPRIGEYRRVAERLVQRLEAAGLAPLALQPESGLPDAEFRALARELERSGQAVFVRPDLAMAPEAYEKVRTALVDACRAEVRVSLGAYRDLLGISRKLAEALLKHFDASGLTRRIGDDRVLRRANRGAERLEPIHVDGIQDG